MLAGVRSALSCWPFVYQVDREFGRRYTFFMLGWVRLGLNNSKAQMDAVEVESAELRVESFSDGDTRRRCQVDRLFTDTTGG